MPKQIISFTLEEDTIRLLDELSLIFAGNRSKLVDWLATRNFFMPQEIVDKAKELQSSIDKFGDKKLLAEIGFQPGIASLDTTGIKEEKK